eukprot:SAG31_NODE_6148_length_2148_cov_1.273792_2_plen_248_part_00
MGSIGINWDYAFSSDCVLADLVTPVPMIAPSDNSSRFSADPLIIEYRAGDALSLLVSHLAKILLEGIIRRILSLNPRCTYARSLSACCCETPEVIGFDAQLVHYVNTQNSSHIRRVAEGTVDVNLFVELDTAPDIAEIELFVEEEDLAIDLGDLGFSVTPGWFTSHKSGTDDCSASDYWKSYLNPSMLEGMLSVHDIEGGIDEFGATVCPYNPPMSFCSASTPGKYYGSACDPVTGMSVSSARIARI